MAARRNALECGAMRRISVTAVLLCCALTAWAEPATTLPQELARSLRRDGLTTDGLSIYVHELGNALPLLAFAADAPRTPASVMKLLPTLAALEELGPAYTWQTELWSEAPLRDATLAGDLYLKGSGDPYLVIEHFWRLLRRLRQAGVATIDGDLVLDDSYFAPEPEDPADFDGRPYRAYNVLPSALLLNFQAVHFRFVPEPDEQRVRIVAEPWPAQLALENQLRLTHGSCRGWWVGRIGMRLMERAVAFNGSYDAACGERDFFRVVTDPVAYVHGVFRSLWTEMGGQLRGGVRRATVPSEARLLASIESPPLADAIRSVNKYSNNVMTRQLLLTLGAVQGGVPGTAHKGIAAVRAWMEKRGLDRTGVVLENGAGLSRNERVSARQLGALLLAAYTSPAMPEFLSSLPVTGLDGTLRHRLGATPLTGRVHLKTGSIDNVNAIAGYVLDRFDRRVAVVVLHNHARAASAAGSAFQDAVLEWVFERAPAQAPAPITASGG
jgi:D-alanyl-D-alanine carboxypeptidase/D-alanyl-D-alanine-endopeptidase (penicillin-binding protein 4)